MPKLQFDAIVSPLELRKKVRDLANDDPSNYKWVKEITDRTTDEAVGIKVNVTESVEYAPWKVSENIQEAMSILDNSLNRRLVIFNLEVEALQTAMDLQLAEQLQESSHELDRVRLKAACAEAQVSENEALGRLEARTNLIASARRARLQLHNDFGSALNYGERVKFERELLADNIRVAQSRLLSVWAGLHPYFGIKLAPPPKWKARLADTDPDPLTEMINWLRNASEKLDIGNRHERFVEIYLSLLDMGIVPAHIMTQGQSQTAGEIAFTLDKSHFPPLDSGECMRMIGLGFAFLCNEVHGEFSSSSSEAASKSFDHLYGYVSQVRRGLTRSLIATLPHQSSDLPTLPTGKGGDWGLPKVTAVAVPMVGARSLREQISIESHSQFMNCSPIGFWKVQLSSAVNFLGVQMSPDGPGQLVKGNNKNLSGDFVSYVTPRDIVIAMRLAIR